MGFFSLRVTCNICEKKCGWNRFQIRDGQWCCAKCFNKAGFGMNTPIMAMSADEIKNSIDQRNQIFHKVPSFEVSKSIGSFLAINETKLEWYIPYKRTPYVHSYSDVIDFELLEDGGSIAKGGIGRAVTGGLLFGGVGAIVGGVTGKRKTSPTCTSLRIKITLKDVNNPTEYIDLIASETKKNSFLYQTCEKQAQEILSIFQIMCESNTAQEDKDATTIIQPSVADEIAKFKKLLDDGIITQEEFEQKKKQLLGL